MVMVHWSITLDISLTDQILTNIGWLLSATEKQRYGTPYRTTAMEVVGFGPSSTILRRNSVILGQFFVTELVSTFTPFIWHNFFWRQSRCLGDCKAHSPTVPWNLVQSSNLSLRSHSFSCNIKVSHFYVPCSWDFDRNPSRKVLYRCQVEKEILEDGRLSL